MGGSSTCKASLSRMSRSRSRSIRRSKSTGSGRGPGDRSRVFVYSYTKINDLPAWPRPVMSDSEGRFTLRGLGRGLDALLTVHHPRFALQRIEIEPDDHFEIEAE